MILVACYTFSWFIFATSSGNHSFDNARTVGSDNSYNLSLYAASTAYNAHRFAHYPLMMAIALALAMIAIVLGERPIFTAITLILPIVAIFVASKAGQSSDALIFKLPLLIILYSVGILPALWPRIRALPSLFEKTHEQIGGLAAKLMLVAAIVVVTEAVLA